MRFQVIDSRNGEVTFESEDKQKCVEYLEKVWEESSTTFIYSYIKEE